MNRDLLKLHWPVLEAKLHQRYAMLGDRPLAWIDGQEDELLHGIAKQVGRPRAEIDGFLQSALSSIINRDSLPRPSMEKSDRLGHPRGSRDLPPAPAGTDITRPPDDRRPHGR